MNLDLSQLKTVKDWILWIENQFSQAQLFFGHGTETALDEAAWLVSAVTGVNSAQLNSILDRPISKTAELKIQKLVATRINERKPLAYLLNEAWFAGLRFYVNEQVIIPRSPFAECILNQFEPWVSADRVFRILDIGTGSGCMAIAAALAFPLAQVDAVDISAEALKVAQKNVMDYELTQRIRLIQSDCFEQLTHERYDIIMSNPPYVGQEEYEDLPNEYHYEPRTALLANKDGLEIVERILKHAVHHLNKDGILVIEVGNSEDLVLKKFHQYHFVALDLEHGGSGLLLLTAEQLLFT